jgi:hypothetical protein
MKGTAPPGLGFLMFETLLVGNTEEPTTAYGLLAEDVTVAADKLSVTFRLHPEARFHNGDAVLAADVKYSFDRLTSKEAAPQFRTYFSEVKAATVLSEREIRFDFKRANAELPLIVGGMAVFSQKWGAGKPLDQVVTDVPIASGPYKLGKTDFGKDIQYVRNPDYWAKNLGSRRGMFNFDRITYKLYKDTTAQFEAFKAGEFDYIQAFVAREWARGYKGKLFDNGTLIKQELQHGNAGDFQGFMFNTRLAKFKDKARQFLRAHESHMSLQRLRRNQPLTPSDLKELERMLLEAGGSTAVIKEAAQQSHGLGIFIRSLVGLDRETAKQAFSQLVAGTTTTASQLEFIDLIVEYLTENGVMEPERLYESPFTDISPQGPEAVFSIAKVNEMVAVLEEINIRARA